MTSKANEQQNRELNIYRTDEILRPVSHKLFLHMFGVRNYSFGRAYFSEDGKDKIQLITLATHAICIWPNQTIKAKMCLHVVVN